MNIDFSECSLIENELKFYTFVDFCKNRVIIKSKYKLLSKNGKLFYKYYVYANVHMKEMFKNAIWDYLNSDEESGFELMRIMRFYKPI